MDWGFLIYFMSTTIYLTAGHHNNDPGAVANGYKENTLNIELRDMIAECIRTLSPATKLCLDDDKDTLSQVIKKVSEKATAKDIWLEIHFDSAANNSATGSTSLVANSAMEKSKLLADDLASATATILEIKNRGVKSEKDSHRGRLAMLHTKAISVLLEVAFVSNKLDMELYESWKHWLSDEIARILIKYAA